MRRALSWLALAFPVLAWGLSFPSIKAALTVFPPMTLALGRFALASIALWTIAALTPRKKRVAMGWSQFTPRDRWSLVLTVFTGITLYFLFENHGVKLIPASAASLIIAVIPILSLLAERILDRRRLGLVGSLATLVSVFGVALLVGVPGGTAESGSLLGSLLMLGAAVAWVCYLFTMRPLQTAYPNLAVTAWQMLLGALAFVPFAWAELSDWRWPSAVGWAHLGFQGMICSATSYLLYNYALNTLGMRTSSLAVNLIPVVTAIASFFFLGEILGPWQWAGGALVLASVITVGLKDQPRG